MDSRENRHVMGLSAANRIVGQAKAGVDRSGPARPFMQMITARTERMNSLRCTIGSLQRSAVRSLTLDLPELRNSLSREAIYHIDTNRSETQLMSSSSPRICTK